MKEVASFQPLGARPQYYLTNGTAHAPRIKELLRRQPVRDWDVGGVRNYLERRPDGRRTCFAGIHALTEAESLWDGSEKLEVRRLARKRREPEPLLPMLERAVRRIADDGKKTAVALSGGLDSALIVALLRKMGRDDIAVVTLATNLPGYCELEATRRAARLLGVNELRVIETGADAMIGSFPKAIAAAEAPLFNLHPVSRWLLAQALKREGFEVLITGDGADQIFAGSDARNYIPIVGAMTHASGLELRSPFFDDELAMAAPPPTPNKAALREAAAAVLPLELLAVAKTARYAPALNVSRHWNEEAIRPLAEALGGAAPLAGSGAEATLWTSLGILSRFMN